MAIGNGGLCFQNTEPSFIAKLISSFPFNFTVQNSLVTEPIRDSVKHKYTKRKLVVSG